MVGKEASVIRLVIEFELIELTEAKLAATKLLRSS